MGNVLIEEVSNTAKNLTLKRALNAATNILEAKMQSSVLHSLPLNVDIVLTRACNLACKFCKNYETPGSKHVSLKNVEKIAKQLFPTALNVNICSGGEPYIHRQFVEILRIARRYKVTTWVLSNGMLLEEDIIRTIVREGLIFRHGFSVDGIKPSTVAAIRVNAKLGVIFKNIETLIRIRKEEGEKLPGIVVRYALMRSNIEELPDAVQCWGEMGIDILECKYLSLCNGIDQQESLYFHQELMENVFKKAKAQAAKYPHLTLRLPPKVQQERLLLKKPRKCPAPWNFIMIDTDGRILPCYKSWGVLDMGNAFEEDRISVNEIWNNSQYQALRRTSNNDNLHKHYSFCSECPRRFGWGNLSAHLEDDTWLKHIDNDATKQTAIAHRHRGVSE